MVCNHFQNRYQSTQEVLQAIEQHVPSTPETLSLDEGKKLLKSRANLPSIAWDIVNKKLPIVLPIALVITLFGLIAWLSNGGEEIPKPAVGGSDLPEVDVIAPTSSISSGETALLSKGRNC